MRIWFRGMVCFQSWTDQHLSSMGHWPTFKLNGSKHKRGRGDEVYRKITQIPTPSFLAFPHKDSLQKHFQLSSDKLIVCYNQYYRPTFIETLLWQDSILEDTSRRRNSIRLQQHHTLKKTHRMHKGRVAEGVWRENSVWGDIWKSKLIQIGKPKVLEFRQGIRKKKEEEGGGKKS